MTKGNREEAIQLLENTSLKLRVISEQTGVPMGSLGALSHKHRKTKYKGIVNRQPKRQQGVAVVMTEEWLHEHLVVQGMTLQEMGDLLGVSRERIRQILSKRGINVSDHANKESRYWRKNNVEKTKLNKHYFDVIDTEEKAYWLGYLTARGRVSDVNEWGRKELFLSIAPKNLEHFERFKETIEADVEILTQRNYRVDKDYYKMRISSHYLASKLEEYHIETPKHDLTRVPEVVPEELVRHYFRGHYDGKGFLHVRPDGEHSMLFMYGSDPMLYDWCKYLVEEVGVELSPGAVSNPSDTHLNHKFTLHAHDKIKKILDHLYADATIYQNRNWSKYRDYFYNRG